jgi:Fe-S cluster biosynthesis and repair protein YggX
MAERTVKCIKLGTELPGLDSPPMPNELGQRIFENVSKQAWKEFLEHFKMVVNEYRLTRCLSKKQMSIFSQMSTGCLKAMYPKNS